MHTRLTTVFTALLTAALLFVGCSYSGIVPKSMQEEAAQTEKDVIVLIDSTGLEEARQDFQEFFSSQVVPYETQESGALQTDWFQLPNGGRAPVQITAVFRRVDDGVTEIRVQGNQFFEDKRVSHGEVVDLSDTKKIHAGNRTFFQLSDFLYRYTGYRYTGSYDDLIHYESSSSPSPAATER